MTLPYGKVHVVINPAVQFIHAMRPNQQIASGVSKEQIITVLAQHNIVAFTTQDGVRPASREETIIAEAT